MGSCRWNNMNELWVFARMMRKWESLFKSYCLSSHIEIGNRQFHDRQRSRTRCDRWLAALWRMHGEWVAWLGTQNNTVLDFPTTKSKLFSRRFDWLRIVGLELEYWVLSTEYESEQVGVCLLNQWEQRDRFITVDRKLLDAESSVSMSFRHVDERSSFFTATFTMQQIGGALRLDYPMLRQYSACLQFRIRTRLPITVVAISNEGELRASTELNLSKSYSTPALWTLSVSPFRLVEDSFLMYPRIKGGTLPFFIVSAPAYCLVLLGSRFHELKHS